METLGAAFILLLFVIVLIKAAVAILEFVFENIGLIIVILLFLYVAYSSGGIQ